MDVGTLVTGILIAALVGIGAFSIMYFAARLALQDDREDEAQKRGRP
jgi:hypothetical protein